MRDPDHISSISQSVEDLSIPLEELVDTFREVAGGSHPVDLAPERADAVALSRW